jgi:hypothetical protein
MRQMNMIENFQNFPAWVIIVFLFVWVFGCFFLLVKKWKERKSSDGFPKEKMILSLTGFSIGISICFLTLSWTKKTLLSGLSGIHAGFVAGMYAFALIFICQLLVKFFWKFSKNYLSDHQE